MNVNCILCVRRKRCPKGLKETFTRKDTCPARIRRLRRPDYFV